MSDEYSEQIDKDYRPYFFIPPNKSYNIIDQTRHHGQFYGLGEIICKAAGSGDLEVQKKYLLDIYKGDIKPDDKAVLTNVESFFENCERL